MRNKNRRHDSGQALLEFALVVPLFLLLLLGIVEFARAWNVYEVLTDATREGTREAVVDNPSFTEADITAVIQNAGMRAGIEIAAGDIQVTGFRSGRGNTTTVRVEYEHEIKFLGNLLDLFSGDNTLSMVSVFSMRNE